MVVLTTHHSSRGTLAQRDIAHCVVMDLTSMVNFTYSADIPYSIRHYGRPPLMSPVLGITILYGMLKSATTCLRNTDQTPSRPIVARPWRWPYTQPWSIRL